VGILPDIAHGLRVSEVTVGNLVSRFATHLTLIGVFLAGNILCALAPNYAVLPHYRHMAKVGFLPQFRMRAGNGRLSALRLRTIPGR
jgi:predicted MFS family arabinose efflux permease